MERKEVKGKGEVAESWKELNKEKLVRMYCMRESSIFDKKQKIYIVEKC